MKDHSDESRMKHLEFIQGVVNRLAQNSFSLKGWSITLVSALFLLSAKESDSKYASRPVVPFSQDGRVVRSSGGWEVDPSASRRFSSRTS